MDSTVDKHIAAYAFSYTQCARADFYDSCLRRAGARAVAARVLLCYSCARAHHVIITGEHEINNPRFGAGAGEFITIIWERNYVSL